MVAFEVPAVFVNQSLVEGLAWVVGVEPGEEVVEGLCVGAVGMDGGDGIEHHGLEAAAVIAVVISPGGIGDKDDFG